METDNWKGKQFRQIRRSKLLTQNELAAKSNLSKQAISLIETGVTRVPGPSTIKALADGLGASLDKLLFLVED
tara:strand:- start:1846 stop:2064 length:219 start_codon:yes stop_codon:yes gene_type:complete